jgi:hypothetical protein
MAYARIATFEGADRSGVDELVGQIRDGDPPEGLPATEVTVLFDGASKVQVITLFDSEEDYRRGDEVLSGLNPAVGGGKRTSLEKYEVALRRST